MACHNTSRNGNTSTKVEFTYVDWQLKRGVNNNYYDRHKRWSLTWNSRSRARLANALTSAGDPAQIPIGQPRTAIRRTTCPVALASTQIIDSGESCIIEVTTWTHCGARVGWAIPTVNHVDIVPGAMNGIHSRALPACCKDGDRCRCHALARKKRTSFEALALNKSCFSVSLSTRGPGGLGYRTSETIHCEL